MRSPWGAGQRSSHRKGVEPWAAEHEVWFGGARRGGGWGRYLALGLALAGCGSSDGSSFDGSAIAPAAPAISRQAVLASLSPSLAVGATGGIVPIQTYTGEVLLTEAEARDLARAWVETFKVVAHESLQKEHGRPIEWSATALCPVAYLTSPYYTEVAPEVDAVTRRSLGPYWLVGICHTDGTPAVSIAVSALATDVRIENGKLRFPQYAGGEFYAMGVPAGWAGPVAVSPAQAVTMASGKFQAQVAQSIELVASHPHFGPPQAATWKVVLDRDIAELGPRSRSEDPGSTVFVGAERARFGAPGAGELLTGSRSPQSSETIVTFDLIPGRTDAGRYRRVESRASFRADVPRELERVSP